MTWIIYMIALVFSTFFFLGMNDFFFAVYSLTQMSSILPFWIVIIAMWASLFLAAVAAMAAIKDVKRGTEWLVICLPMSALPFIFLGVPLSALNTVFICRALLNMFVYVLFMKWFLQSSLNSRLKLQFPLLGMIGLWAVVYLVNIGFVEPDLRHKVIESIVIFVSCVMFFYMIVNLVRDERMFLKFLEIMVIACIVQVVMSSFSFVYYLVIKHRASFRVEGMLRDYELFAEYLALHIPVFIFLMRNPGELIPPKVLKLFLVLTIFVLLATATRGAIISLGIGLIYYLAKMRRRLKVTGIAMQIVIWGIGIGIVLAALYKFLPQSAQIIERFSSTRLSSLDTRHAVWLEFWSYFKEKPLTGHGIIYNLGTQLFFPHSTYLYFLLTLGVPGLAVYLLFVCALLQKGLQAERNALKNNGPFEMAVVVNTLLIVFLIDGIKIEYLRYPNYQLFAWFLFGLVTALSQWTPVMNKNSRTPKLYEYSAN